MENPCIIIHGKHTDDQRFRPGTAVPELHWAYRLLDAYADYDQNTGRVIYPQAVSINWGGESGDVISVEVNSDLWKNNAQCFEQLMRFIKNNNLTYEFPCNMLECTKCEGHPSCVANAHRNAQPIQDEQHLAESSRVA